MATKGQSVPERIARWKVLVTGLRPMLAEMRHLAPLHAELERIIQECEALDARAEALKAESREVTSTRDALAGSGDDLRRRMGAALQTTYGFRSEKLLEFGIPPRRARGRDKKPRVRRKPEPAAAPASRRTLPESHKP